jgi:NitT/TauT family transport system ATP-binding protein
MPNGPAAITHGIGIQLRGVRQVFEGGVVALDGVYLDIPPGEFAAILGPSGCGKSTLLRLIAELDAPTSGSVQRSDSSSGGVEYAHARFDVACVFQDAHLLPWRSVLNNVALPLELRHQSKAARLAEAMQAIARVGMADAAGRYPAQLSGGMRMRVSLARALVTHPRLLLLDEPFAALDEITRQRLDEQLRELWLAMGMTVVFVTHSIAEAVFLSDRALLMSRRPGRIVLDQRIDLPPQRDESLRSEISFARQMRPLFERLREEQE